MRHSEGRNGRAAQVERWLGALPAGGERAEEEREKLKKTLLSHSISHDSRHLFASACEKTLLTEAPGEAGALFGKEALEFRFVRGDSGGAATAGQTDPAVAAYAALVARANRALRTGQLQEAQNRPNIPLMEKFQQGFTGPQKYF